MNSIPEQIQNSVSAGQQPISQPEVSTQPQVENKPVTQPDSSQMGEGFNLIPSITEEERTDIKTKNKANIGSIISLIILLSISLVIVGFNIISKQQLNVKKNEQKRIETTLNQQADKIIANEAIVDRAVLFENVRKNAFSHKKIIEFLTQMGVKVGGIEVRSVVISEKLNYTFVGTAVNLEQVSKLWYLLGIDENIEKINLSSVSKSDNRVRFTFDGVFNGQNFYNK